MDGLFHGSKPYEQMDDLGAHKNPYFWVDTHIFSRVSVKKDSWQSSGGGGTLYRCSPLRTSSTRHLTGSVEQLPQWNWNRLKMMWTVVVSSDFFGMFSPFLGCLALFLGCLALFFGMFSPYDIRDVLRSLDGGFHFFIFTPEDGRWSKLDAYFQLGRNHGHSLYSSPFNTNHHHLPSFTTVHHHAWCKSISSSTHTHTNFQHQQQEGWIHSSFFDFQTCFSYFEPMRRHPTQSVKVDQVDVYMDPT